MGRGRVEASAELMGKHTEEQIETTKARAREHVSGVHQGWVACTGRWS